MCFHSGISIIYWLELGVLPWKGPKEERAEVTPELKSTCLPVWGPRKPSLEAKHLEGSLLPRNKPGCRVITFMKLKKVGLQSGGKKSCCQLVTFIWQKSGGGLKRERKLGKQNRTEGKNLYDEVPGRMKEQKEGFLPVSWYFPTQQKNPLCSLRGKKKLKLKA